MQEFRILTHDSAKHNPPHEVFDGKPDDAQEVPARVETITQALVEAGLSLETTSETVPHAVLEAIHSPAYLKFMREYSASIPEGAARYPSVFSLRSGRTPEQNVAKHGHYSFDTYTPLLKETFAIAESSAALAYVVAKEVSEGIIPIGYALCRPPGHHAEPEQSGGYCYINNAAVAAQHLREYGKVATLDVDFHHGNGTQAIFYDRNDVMTASIHANPNWKFPFMAGFADETGVGKGSGLNANYPLEEGTTNEQYQATLETALEQIAKFKPEFLVVSYGADTHAEDPIGGFKLSTDYYEKMAKTIKELNLPTVIVQEGGYNNSLLGLNVVSFLRGFEIA